MPPCSNLAGYDPTNHNGEFYFDPIAAERPIEFCERWLRHVDGVYARQPFILEPWQKDIVRTLFGWKHSAGPRQGLRRFKVLLLEVPRGNGKSTFSSFLANYMCGFDQQYGAEVYLAAVTQDQALATLRQCAQQIRLNKSLQKFYTIREAKSRILCRKQNSFIHAMPSEVGAAHGKKPLLIVCDEVHEWQGFKGREFFNALETSMGKLQQPMMLVTSTAGYDRQSVFWDLHQYGKRCVSNPATDYSFLPVIYAANPDTEDWQDIETAKKCNPNWGVGVQPDYIATQLKKAKENPLEENKYKRLHLNIWTENLQSIIPMADWDLCPTTDIDLTNQPCVGGLDTSSTTDLTAFALWFPKQKAIRVWFWIPGEHARTKSLVDGVDYLTWQNNSKANLCFVNRRTIDRQLIIDKILELKLKYKIQGVAFDPWERKVGIIDDLHKKGVRMIEHGQTYSVMNAPTKLFIQSILDHQLNHGDNPCFSWNVSNLAIKTLSDSFIRPVKPEDTSKRIDGCVAAIMAMGVSKSVSMVTVA